ncbi:MAG: hypothetical protein C4554_08885 [Dethiobacter sp.]|jgi:branched-chain amino acid transport system substrate-binding protein|nr:MAG: hypothetical protein C4554_08885 [Dethiobacter sp.]
MLIVRKLFWVSLNIFLTMLICVLFFSGCAKPEIPTTPDVSKSGSEPAVEVPDTIKIGAILSFTGADSNLGAQVQAGYEMAVEDVNKEGGVYVKEYDKKIPLELIILDMESSGEKAIARAETLHSKYNVVAYLGSTFISAASGVSEKNQVPTLVVASASQSVHERGYNYWFGVTPKTPDIAEETFNLLDSIPENERPTRIAIFEEQTDFGIEQSLFFQKVAAQRGYNVVTVEKYAMLSKDFSSHILTAKAENAEIILSCPIMPDGMTMLRQMKELDYNPKITFLFRAADDLSWTQAMRAIGDYVIASGGWHYDMDYPGVAELNTKYQAKFGRPADMQAGPGYASIQVLASAIEKAGTLDRNEIRDAIAATDIMTVVGPVKFRENGTNLTPCNAIVQWQNGKLELIWPPEHAKKDIIFRE